MRPTVDSPFQHFELSNEELVRGHNLSPESRAIIQNYMADAATDLVTASLEQINEPVDNMRRAYLKGQIDTCKFLLQVASDLPSTESIDSQI